jgi:3-deoxy-D-manno-octulosonic-acid transferase
VLGVFDRAAPVAFRGGSLVPHGGQNPIEAVRLDAAVLHGPYVHNFADIYAELDRAVPLAPITDAPRLAEAAGVLLADPLAAAERAAKAGAAIAHLTGALDASMAAIKPFLSTPVAA